MHIDQGLLDWSESSFSIAHSFDGSDGTAISGSEREQTCINGAMGYASSGGVEDGEKNCAGTTAALTAT